MLRAVRVAAARAPGCRGLATQGRQLAQPEGGEDGDVASTVLLDVGQDGFATITLNNPKLFNAFSDKVIQRCTDVFEEIGSNPAVRGAFVKSTGKLFCAGADLRWMRRTATFSEEENERDATKLGLMLQLFNQLPFPTIALVQGMAFGGGVGLVSCCDIAVAVDKAEFKLSEVRLGLIPATISPYVVEKIGAHNARRYFLTAEPIPCAAAKQMGLVHEVVQDAEGLAEWEAHFRACLREVSPTGAAAAKELIRAVDKQPITEELIVDTARRLARQRASPEGREGLAAFFEKRKPSWNA